jgi:CheY-like chemotaxis protein
MKKTLEILLIEDNSADANYAREILKEASVPMNLHCVVDGADALAFIYRQARFVQAPRPDLILLDLNLPGVDGREFLDALANDPEWKAVPVLVLTGSYAASDRTFTTRRNVRIYLSKPLNLAQFEQSLFEIGLMESLGDGLWQASER